MSLSAALLSPRVDSMSDGPNMMDLFTDLRTELRADIRELRDRLLSAVEAMAALQATIESSNSVELLRQLESRIDDRLEALEARLEVRFSAAEDRLASAEHEVAEQKREDARTEGMQRGFAAGLGALGGTGAFAALYGVYQLVMSWLHN